MANHTSAYIENWRKDHTTRVYIRLNNNTDADILSELEKQISKQGFVKDAIRYYIANGCPSVKKNKAD